MISLPLSICLRIHSWFSGVGLGLCECVCVSPLSSALHSSPEMHGDYYLEPGWGS